MAVTRDQTATGAFGSGSSVTITWATLPTAGAKALVVIQTGGTVSTVKDNGAVQSTFTQDQLFAGPGGDLVIYRADGIHLPSSGSYAVTITFGASDPYDASGRTYLGVATGGPGSTNSNTGTGTTTTTGNVTPPVTGSLIIGGFANDSGLNPETITLTTSGASALFTNANGTDICGGAADNIPANTTAQGLTWTTGDSVDWAGHIAVYSPVTSSTPSPFTPPARPARGKRAAAKARLRSSAGSPLVLPGAPAHFTIPVKAARGKPAARKARLASSPGSPAVARVPGLGLFRTEAGGRFRAEDGGFLLVEGAVTPSPFAIPVKAARGKPAARKSRIASSAGSPAAGSAPAVPSPFVPPAKPARGRPAARKGRTASSPGAPVIIPSPFAVPATPARGKRAAAKSRAASSAGSPLVLPPPSPSAFSAPAKPAKGKPAAARSRITSSPGSPVVAPPPITPSPFALPAAIQRAHAAVRKARLASSPGSPAVLSVSPFAVPTAAARGKPAARKSRLTSSPGAPLVIPSPFALPGTLKRGKPAIRKARAAFSAGSPVALPPGAPSPFAAPARPARGRPAAAKARLRSSAGSPAVIPGWTIIGTMAQTATTSLALTPAHAGDLIFVDVVSVGAPPTGISGGGCTWQQVGTPLTGVVNAGDYAAAYEGTVITTGSIVATLAFTGTPTTIRCVAQEAQSSTGAWIVDGPQGNLDSSGTNTLPSLTPTAPGDLYIGYTFDNSTATAGSTPGYTYDIDSHGNGLAFNPDCGSGAQAPVWGTSTCAIGISVLFKAVVPSPPATPAPFSAPAKPARGKAAARKARTAFSAGSPAVVAPPPPPFPQVPLDLRCELNLSGTWTDVSGYVYQRSGEQAPVTITRGRPDESSQANPSASSWEWNNRDGRFSPKNPLSPYYGALGRNTPVRWSVPAEQNYLRLENDAVDRAFVNDQTRLGITGSIEMRIALRLTDWQGCMLASKWDGGGCWAWQLTDDGTMAFSWFDASANSWEVTSTAPVPYASGDFALRVTMDATTGNVTFYTAASIDGTYTQLGSVSSPTGGATSIQVQSGSALLVGFDFDFTPGQLFGRVYEYRLYNGIAGTVAADAVFTSLAAGATSFTDAPGNAWTIAGGAEISSRDYRFHGEMSAQPPKWDVTGTDMSVAAAAGGPLRRLTQGTDNTLSALKRAILAQAGALAPVAYWPMEDAAGSTSFGSAIGGLPMTFDQSPAPTLATSSDFVASAPLPEFNGSRLQGPVAPYTDTGTWTVRFLLDLAAPAADATLLRIVASPWAACPVLYVNADTSGNLEFIGYEPGGSEAFNTGYVAFGAAGNPLMISVEAQPASGGNTQYSLVAVAPGASSGGVIGGTASGSAGTVSVVQPDVTGAFGDTVMGHLQVQSAWQSLFAFGQPLNAWTGETAGARYARLCAENGYQARIIGSPGQSVVMGPQSVDTLSDLLQECETADIGQQFEARQQLALGYRTLASMCGQSPQLTISYPSAQAGGVSGDATDSGLDPTYDDQLSANDWTVTRGSASGAQGATWQSQLNDGSAMSISPPPDGIGDYAKTQTANVQYDAQVPDVAGWLVHAGTVDEARWPVIPLNLARPEMTASWWQALAVDIGDYLQLDSLPDTVLYDPVKQLAFGTKESLGGFHYAQEFSAVPESAYEVIILGDPVYGRVDTDGSQLASGVSATATTLSVSTTGPSGILWSPNSSDWPFDIAVGGERMTVTAVSGTTSPQSLTVTRSVNGVVKAQAAGTDVRLWFPPILSLT